MERSAKTTLTRFILAMKFFAHSHSAAHASRIGRKMFGLPVYERRSVRLSLAFARSESDWLCSRCRRMKDCYRIPQRNCGRFSRPSLDLPIGLTRTNPDACHAKERDLVIGFLQDGVNPPCQKSPLSPQSLSCATCMFGPTARRMARSAKSVRSKIRAAGSCNQSGSTRQSGLITKLRSVLISRS